ncbi:hypothetical protein HanHA300_Chr17g0638361 [Helianthus annuus]|nr:hypothetical protein HanHA300_Chr17g0638361 [Helianthus annuus]
MRSLQFCCFLLIIGCLVSQIYASSYAAILYDKFFFEGSQIVSEKGDHSGKIIVTIRLRLILHTKVYFDTLTGIRHVWD